MKIVILLMEQNKQLIPDITKYVSNKFGITESLDISIKNLIRLPRNEHGYTVDHLGECIVITDYYGVIGANVKRVDDVNDVSSLAEIIASNFISPKVFFTDDLTVAKRWLDKLPDTFAYDTETTGLAIKDVGNYTMHSFSIDLVKSFVLIDTPEIRALIISFLITTNKTIPIHNAAFDLRPIFRMTGKFPKNYEDTMLIAQAYMNHIGLQAYSLKTLAGGVYGDWASAKTTFNLYEDSSEYQNTNLIYKGNNPDTKQYNLPLIYYAGIDSSACLYLWYKFAAIDSTWKAVSIEAILPIQEPREHEESPRYFYENVLKPLIQTTIRILETPMPVDMKVIEEIKQEALDKREPAFAKLQEFPRVKEYMTIVKNRLIQEFIEPLQIQKSNWPIKEFKYNVKDRTILCNFITGESRESWKVVDIKTSTEQYPIFQSILGKDVEIKYPTIVQNAMNEYRSIPQQKLEDKLTNPLEYIDPKKLSINPNASVQMRGLYKYLGLVSDVLTPAKEESFNKDVITEIAKTTPDEGIKEIIKQVLFISETKNLLAQYIPKYFGSEVNGFCFGSIKFPGTISYRGSSGMGKGTEEDQHSRGIPLMTLPAITKRATVAKEGWVLVAADFANLEGYIGALLMNDPTKKKILVDNYDSHCLHTSYYFTDEVERLMGIPFVDTLEFNQKFNKMRKENKELDKLRSLSKGVSFGLIYGAYPKKVAHTLKQPLSVGEALFNRFHNDLYPASTKYKEEYVLPTTQQQGYIHLGLGARLYSNQPDKDVRTLGNATIQFFSVLTMIAIHRVQLRIKEAGYEGKISIYSTVHDSIMAHVIEDVEVIKWFNDNLIDCMTKDFLIDQEVKLSSNCDIGYVYSNLTEITNNAPIEEIKKVLSTL